MFDDHIAAVKAGTAPSVCSGALLPARIELMAYVMQNARGNELMGNLPEMDPMKVLDMIKTAPPMWCFHGADDTIVPAELTRNFVDKAQSLLGKSQIKGSYPSGDHGVGNELTVNDSWVKEGLQWVEKFWP